MGCVQVHARGAALVMGLQETARTQAPSVASLKACKTEFGTRRAQVISDIFRKGQELIGHDRANRMAARVLRASVTSAIAEIACHWGGGANLKLAAEDVK